MYKIHYMENANGDGNYVMYVKSNIPAAIFSTNDM